MSLSDGDLEYIEHLADTAPGPYVEVAAIDARQLVREVRRLRGAIRDHRLSHWDGFSEAIVGSRSDLALWSVLPQERKTA